MTRRKTRGDRREEKKACCGPPVPATAPKGGMCLNPLECAEAMKALSDPNRIKLIRALIGRERTVSEISRVTGLAPSRVSHHLGRMRLAGLVESVRNGRTVVYSVSKRIATEWGLDLGCSCIMFRKLQ